ncbi:thiamine-binding protein [Flaviaesturariibacter flavus]|uniref:Thiamine-binding protein n=1 Tax=Flaviaesturariibacter flavus TaxID=2502780 RepID=A0A4R1BJN4_9BACT|nr:thiamine-binding protein [Flaviaesturariibacter flavus]TCJ17418.1 thiamine-binding protein [Flaviaesturariibacter flavus]
MHTHTVNASLQLVPIVEDRHPYEWVDEAIDIIKASGIAHEVGPFSTVLEGSYEAVMHVFHNVNDHLQQRGCAEWIVNFQLQVRAGGPITGEEKVEKFRDLDRRM